MKSIIVLLSASILATHCIASETNVFPSQPSVRTNGVGQNDQALSDLIESAVKKSELEKQTPLDTNTISDNEKASLAMLKPGMTRAELEKHFEMDGGLNGPGTQRYFIRDKKSEAKVIMVEVSFHTDGLNKQSFPFNPDDVITKIGNPYYSTFHND